MANYHLRAKVLQRGKGASAVAAAAYRHAVRLADERQGVLHDYRRKRGVLHSELVIPASAKGWTPTREELWNAVEAKNKREDAVLARELEIALPVELSADARRDAIREIARYVADRYSVAVDAAIHAPNPKGDDRNYHAHLMLTANRVDGARFGNKVRELDFIAMRMQPGGKDALNEVDHLRRIWADIANAALEKAGLDIRIDHRSNEARGMDAEPTQHVGVHATSIDRKFADGEADAPSARGALNDNIRVRNAERAKLKEEHAQITAEIIDLDAEREKRQNGDAEAKARDPLAIMDALTERRATFTRRELSRHLSDFIPDMQERIALTNEILARPEIVPLREDEDAPVSRYTTRAVLDGEQQILTAAECMNRDKSHGITARGLADMLDVHSQLDDEQRAAVAHATAPGRIVLIAGEAGTGKSTTLAAIRDAYDAEGYRVMGLSWTNAVVQDMKAGGFDNASTVAAELMRLDNGRSEWNPRTVIMVDEAAMLSTKHLARLMQKADASGAKLILAGDDKQLASIERGGMFGALRAAHGAAELHNVYRVADADQKLAFNAMHEGDFRAALEIYDRRGAIHWNQTPDDSRAALVAQWASDTAAAPGKTRFIFAYTNAEVDALNRDARAIRKERGELGEDHTLKTKDGLREFATGDRVQFVGSAATRERREAGLFNGAVGTLEAIDGRRVTVRLDGPKDAPPRSVSFTVGPDAKAGEFDALRHGYAGTIYKGQGKTLDQSYVLHSDNWRSATSYVALSRHRDSVTLFAAEKAAPWIMAEGGVDRLTDAQRESAARSYAAWAEAKPRLAARHGFADYVGYVQAQWQDEKDLRRLDRMARQMGRVEEIRAASQFVEGERPEPEQAAPLSFAEQIDAHAAALGAARGMAQADPAELAAAQNLLADLDAKAKAAAPGSKEQQRALTQSRNVERDLLRLQGKLPGEDSEAECEVKKADWAQAFEATLSEALDNAASYSDRLQIRAEFSRLAHAHDEQQDDDKGRFRTREPDRGRTR